MRRILLIGAAALLSACASTLPEDFAFDPGSGEALLAFDSSVVRESGTLILVSADLETGTFDRLPDPVTAGYRNRIELDDPTAGRIYLNRMEPGTYAIAGVIYTLGQTMTTTCFSRGTVVFDLREGEVGVLSGGTGLTGNGRFMTRQTPADRLARARNALAAVPGVPLDISAYVVEPVAAITFEPGLRLIGAGCPGTSDFQTLEGPVVTAGDDAAVKD